MEIHRGDKTRNDRGKRRGTHVCVEDGHKIDSGHQQIIAHVVLALHAGGSTEIGADGDIRSTRYIAGLSKTGSVNGNEDGRGQEGKRERRHTNQLGNSRLGLRYLLQKRR